MSNFYIRLDDASPIMNYEKWKTIEYILTKHNLKPLFGIIPNIGEGDENSFFLQAKEWIDSGWIPALHGYDHICKYKSSGINPVNNYSEFAGGSLEEQCQKIELGLLKLSQYKIFPKVFFPLAHTFDKNTLKALKNSSNIRIVSDYPGLNYFTEDEFIFIPVQANRVINFPSIFRHVTFCLHPDKMTKSSFLKLDDFLSKYNYKFSNFPTEQAMFPERQINILDRMYRFLYYKKCKHHLK